MNATTKPTEAELWDAYGRDRSVENRNRLVELHMPLAAILSKMLASRMPDNPIWDEGSLLTEASIGLIQAVEGFEPDRGWKFATFAAKRIRGAMLDAVRNSDWVPRTQRALAKITGDRCSEMVRMPTRESDYDEAMEFENSIPAREHVEDDPEWLDHPRTSGVGSRSRLILERLYRCGRTMREVGEELGCSESRVSQMHARILQEIVERADADVPRSQITPKSPRQAALGEPPRDTFPTSSHRDLIDHGQRDRFIAAFIESDGDIEHAAYLLGVSLPLVRERINQYLTEAKSLCTATA